MYAQLKFAPKNRFNQFLAMRVGGRVYLLLTLKLFVLEAINWLERPLNSMYRLNCTERKVELYREGELERH